MALHSKSSRTLTFENVDKGVAAAVMSPHASPRKRQLELDLIKLAREHFRKADADTSGTLDRQELKTVVRELAQVCPRI